MLSIIIPTLNEEKYLPLLLDSIKKQNFSDYEIIVADAGSSDKTREIAKKYNCKIVEGGTPSVGKNNGARVANGELILFLDADTVLSDNFSFVTLQEFQERNLDGATFLLRPSNTSGFQHFLCHFFYNLPLKFFSRFLPFGAIGFLVKKEAHKINKGFDNEAIFLEDIEYVKRFKKRLKYGIIKREALYFSMRRYQEKSHFIEYSKIILGYFYVIFFGPIKKDIFKYKFGHYDKNNSNQTFNKKF